MWIDRLRASGRLEGADQPKYVNGYGFGVQRISDVGLRRYTRSLVRCPERPRLREVGYNGDSKKYSSVVLHNLV